MVLLAAPAKADELDIGGKIGTSAADIVKVLGDNGYELHEYERDDGYIEVEARSDSVDLEMKIDPDSGEIVKIEKEHRTAYEKKRGPGKKGRGKARRGDDDDASRVIGGAPGAMTTTQTMIATTMTDRP